MGKLWINALEKPPSRPSIVLRGWKPKNELDNSTGYVISIAFSNPPISAILRKIVFVTHAGRPVEQASAWTRALRRIHLIPLRDRARRVVTMTDAHSAPSMRVMAPANVPKPWRHQCRPGFHIPGRHCVCGRRGEVE